MNSNTPILFIEIGLLWSFRGKLPQFWRIQIPLSSPKPKSINIKQAKNADRNASRLTILRRHMDSILQNQQATPFPYTRSQRPFLQHHFSFLFPHLLHSCHQNPTPPTLPSPLFFLVSPNWNWSILDHPWSPREFHCHRFWCQSLSWCCHVLVWG